MRAAPSPPELSAHDEATLSFYAREAPFYSASGPGGASGHLAGFLRRLAPGACVLELGCGGGPDSEEILAHGFQLASTGGVFEIARRAETRIGQLVRVMRFGDLSAVEAYDAVWANASLLHVPHPALQTILSNIFRALRPGGIHFASFKGGGCEGRDSLGRYFNYLSIEVSAAYKRQSGTCYPQLNTWVAVTMGAKVRRSGSPCASLSCNGSSAR